jgi:hypothetical protein
MSHSCRPLLALATGGGNRQEGRDLALQVLQGIYSLAMFGLLLASWSGIRQALRISPKGRQCYDIFTRDGGVRARANPTSPLDAAIYAGAFYVAVPYMGVKWGWKRSFFLILLPHFGIGLGYAANYAYHIVGDERFLAPYLSFWGLRACCGLLAWRRGPVWTKRTLISRGWVMAAQVQARRRRAALDAWRLQKGEK